MSYKAMMSAFSSLRPFLSFFYYSLYLTLTASCPFLASVSTPSSPYSPHRLVCTFFTHAHFASHAHLTTYTHYNISIDYHIDMQALRLIALLSFVFAQALATSLEESHLHSENNITRRGPGGWNNVQYPTGAHKSSIPVHNGRLELFAMAKKGIDKKKLKRAVFVIHGQVC